MSRNILPGFMAVLMMGMTGLAPNAAAQGNTFELRYVIGDKLDGDTRPIGLGGQMELLADGSIVFVGIIAGNETGLFQASGNRLITSVARIGDPIPVGTDNNNTIRLVPDPRTNFHVDNNGLVYFNARIGDVRFINSIGTEPLVSSSTAPSSLLFSSFVETITSPEGDVNNALIASLLDVSSNSRILANVTTKSGNPALEPGLYAGANASSISPVALRHSPAPGLPGTTFQSFGIGNSTIIKDDGTIYFGATLFAPDGSFPASIWTTAGGNLHLIARDEMAIPGLADGVINIKGGSSPNFKILPVDGQRTIIFGEERATADPGTPQARVFSSTALFLDTAGGNLAPLALVGPL